MLETAKLRVHRGGAQLWLKRSIIEGLGVRESDKDVPLLIDLRQGFLVIKRVDPLCHDDVIIGRGDGK